MLLGQSANFYASYGNRILSSEIYFQLMAFMNTLYIKTINLLSDFTNIFSQFVICPEIFFILFLDL